MTSSGKVDEDSADVSRVEANNGYEYRIVRVRAPWFQKRAAQRLLARAGREGWEVVHSFIVDGLVASPAFTLRRSIDRRTAAPANATRTPMPAGRVEARARPADAFRTAASDRPV
jgi:hypothetical protein